MSTPVSEGIPRLLDLMEVVRQLDPLMPAHTLMAFLVIANAEPDGLMQQELSNKLGLSSAAVTRNVSFLSEERGVGLPGHGLIVSEMVPENRKLRRLKLTAKGRKYAEKLAKVLQ